MITWKKSLIIIITNIKASQVMNRTYNTGLLNINMLIMMRV